MSMAAVVWQVSNDWKRIPHLQQETGYYLNKAFWHGHHPKNPQRQLDMEQEPCHSEGGQSVKGVDENEHYQHAISRPNNEQFNYQTSGNYLKHSNSKWTTQTLIITVCEPGMSFRGGSGPPQSGSLFSSLIGVPIHLTLAWPSWLVSMSALSFSALLRFTGKPLEVLPRKKSVILVVFVADAPGLIGLASLSCSLEHLTTGLHSSRSGVKGWVSSSESERAGFW